MNIVHLADKDAGDGDEERSAVHIDVTSDGEHEPRDAGVDPEWTFHSAKRHGEGSCPGN